VPFISIDTFLEVDSSQTLDDVGSVIGVS